MDEIIDALRDFGHATKNFLKAADKLYLLVVPYIIAITAATLLVTIVREEVIPAIKGEEECSQEE